MPSPLVAVIGAGPVGQTAALALARWGVDVVVLDGRPERDPIGSKAICQQRDVLDFWSALGGGAIADEGLTWSRARTYLGRDELFCIELPDPGASPLPPFVNISQARTEQVLDAAMAASPRIDVRWGHAVTGIEQDEHGVTLSCAANGDKQIRADYVIACGGARATELRSMLGVDFEGRTFDDPFLICDIEVDMPGWANERRFYFDPEWNPGRQVLIHPCPNGLFRIDWQVDGTFNLEQALASGEIDRRIRHIVGDVPYRLDWTSVYRFHSRVASRFVVGRVLLAGDMAHLVAPFGARGLNSGAPDAENAAWKVAWALKGLGGIGLIDSYEHERKAAALENLAVTTATMDFLVPQDDRAKESRRQLLLQARTDPAARARVDSGRLAEAFWYVDSPLTTPSQQHPWPGRPPRGESPSAVPGVVIPDVPVRVPGKPEVTRLRQLARTGLLALCGAAVDVAGVREALADAAGPAPSAAYSVAALDPSGRLAQALGLGEGESWLVRPDAHTCACVRTTDELTAAVTRALAR